MTRPMAPLEQNQLTNNRFFDTETNINDIMQPSKIYLQINRDQGVSEITLLGIVRMLLKHHQKILCVNNRQYKGILELD